MTVKELIDRTEETLQRFRSVEKRPWTPEACMTELMAEAGTLADSIMIREGYRSRGGDHKVDLEDDISDVLFMLIMICQHYGIDLEKAYRRMLDDTDAKLKSKGA
jgi:NTP pyrophosphatase (non-canonical NTP hydrolase)